MTKYLLGVAEESWALLLDASLYILFGILVAGLIKVFLSPESVARHLGQGRVRSVFKAALLGVPMPLCSCGVLPAAASLKRQGANNGATTAFLIATPESGVDSIALTYALLDPLMTVIRPVAAMVTAIFAGLTENALGWARPSEMSVVDTRCPVDGCCDGRACPPEIHRHHHTWSDKVVHGLRYAFGDLWRDIAPWFFVGVAISGLISAGLPEDVFAGVLGGGLGSMLIMLLVGIPLYICATASTPIAATLILKGVSPGAALVFLLVGPATNVTSLTVLFKILGKRGLIIYLSALAGCAVLFGLAADAWYAAMGISVKATVGRASEVFPVWLEILGAIFLIGISTPPLFAWLRRRNGRSHHKCCAHDCGGDDSCDRVSGESSGTDGSSDRCG